MKKKLISILLCGSALLSVPTCGYLRSVVKQQSRIEYEEKNKELIEKGKQLSAQSQNPKELLESVENTETTDSKNLQPKDFEDSEKKFKISVPNSWKEIDEIKKNNPEISIAVGDCDTNCYASLMYVSKKNLSSDITLEKYNNTLIQKINKEEKDNSGVYDVKDIEINGYKAKTFLLNSTVEFQSRSRYAVIELPNNFVCIRTWTKAGNWYNYMSTAQKIVSSFQSLNSGK
ncbi:PsbP-related protein [Clostridium sp. JS66]|uniref:PsbP-related protein n=1 Tax=Clostridium sp. JS66 TaxID=3064705 RepID=UPI00298DF893|nr:hypothetical protein [Clostridium sp. JS66]WPC39413.1 hypothetical protein Q6H37_15985 [Clostridium sp. JS66]